MPTDKELIARYDDEVKEAGLDPAYVYDLCVEVYTDLLDRSALGRTINGVRSPMERTIRAYMKHWNCAREKAERRYRDHAQICSPTVRATLKILQSRNALPKAAQKSATATIKKK